jgi:ketosteroid isomerase-like protein
LCKARGACYTSWDGRIVRGEEYFDRAEALEAVRMRD